MKELELRVVSRGVDLPPQRHASQRLLAERRDQIEALTLAGDWNGAASAARDLATLAEQAGHLAMLGQAGRALERIRQYRSAYAILAKVGRMRANVQRPDWDGSVLRSGSLLIEDRFKDVGPAIRVARLIARAAERVDSCTVLIEPRLVTLFQRTFPAVCVKTSGAGDDMLRGDASAIASLQSLCALFATDEVAIQQSFVPLEPDRGRLTDLRCRYLSEPKKPLVGLFWRSLNENKDMPPHQFWAELIRDTPADFVSLQYGDVEDDLNEQRRIAGRVAFHDSQIDQMTDIDGFAAQVAALDAVVTISSTTAHVAGALGVPCIVVRDDKLILAWPATGPRSPWYPATVIVRRLHRQWADVLEEVRHILAAVLNKHSPAS